VRRHEHRNGRSLAAPQRGRLPARYGEQHLGEQYDSWRQQQNGGSRGQELEESGQAVTVYTGSALAGDTPGRRTLDDLSALAPPV